MSKTPHIAILLLIWLMMTLPVAHAQEILTINKFSGVDGVNGYAKENDILTIEILAEMLGNPNENVAVQRARVYHGDTYEFMDGCDPQAQAMQECTYETSDLVYGGEDEYEVRLYDESRNEIAREERTLTVDFLGPRIIAFAVSPEASSEPVLTTVTYNVEDYGSSTGQTTECSGIKMLNVTANGETVGIDSADVGVCSLQGSIPFTPTVGSTSEVVTVCAVAYDHLNHRSLPSCKNILIDSKKPTPETLELRDNNGFVITHARTNQIVTADILVRIPDVDIDPTQVFADLSDLNPSLGRIARQDQSGEWFVWRDVTITQPDNCKVTVDATDLLGNSDSKTLTCTIAIDDDGPTPNSITTQFADDDGTPILGANGTIHVDFTESGSGMDKNNAFLDLRQLGKGREVKADQCDKTGASSWDCAWDIIPTVASGDHSISIQPVSRDDLDNQVTTTIDQTIRFDNTAPGGLTIVEIAAFRGDDRVRTEFTSLDEVLEFVVSGAGFTDVVADFTDLGGSSEQSYEQCVVENTTRTCVFGITVGVSGPQPTNVTFTFSDNAGNEAEISTNELEILGISNETNPNYWTVSTDCSPPVLDRSTLSVYDHPVYCRIDMTSTNSQASPITVTGPLDPMSECTGDTEYISDFRMENAFAGSTEPYLVLSLIPTDYEINKLSFTCPISTLTKVGNFIPQNFEQDNITVELDLYNLPLGEIYDNIGDELDEVEDRVGGVLGFVGKLQKFMEYAEKICKFLNIFMGIVSLLATISLWLGIAEAVVKAIPVVGPPIAEAMNAIESRLCDAGEKGRTVYNDDLLGIFKKFCDVITCQAGLFDVLSWTGAMDSKDAAGAEAGTSDWYYSWAGAGTEWGEGQLRGSVSEGGQQFQDPNVYLNVKDSLVYSIVIPPFCVPGIIYNLDKLRQIECGYGLCLLEDYREQGLPLSVCKDQKSYMYCRFVVGELFHLVPFAPIVDYYSNMIQNAISDPTVLIGMGIAVAANCKAVCPGKTVVGIQYMACAGLEIASQLGQSLQMYDSIKSVGDFGNMGNQLCEDFEDALDDFKSSESAGGGATVTATGVV